jgi:hypothetical protein
MYALKWLAPDFLYVVLMLSESKIRYIAEPLASSFALVAPPLTNSGGMGIGFQA